MPGAHLKRSETAVAPAPQEESQRGAALGEADLLERRELVQRRQCQHRAGKPLAAAIPGKAVPEEAVAELEEAVGEDAGGGPNEEVAAREDERANESVATGHLGVEGDRGRDRREHHRRHHHHPDAGEPAERSEVAARSAVHSGHLVRGDPPGEGGEAEQQYDQRQPRPRGREGLSEFGAPGPRVGECWGTGGAYAAHENSEEEKPDLPSYWIPKTSIFDRVACE